ncbi:hypothetical protein FRC17_010754 [Serendipita sp. 399]|nr:hypothetical protein FRC17_010754 [Serendipita sp. 399]
MDRDALKVVEDRQIALRQAYEAYRHEFHDSAEENRAHPHPTGDSSHSERPTSLESTNQPSWISNSLKRDDIRDLVEGYLESDEEYSRLRSNSSRFKLKEQLVAWLVDFTTDTGSMFRLYRKSGFDVERATERLQTTLELRMHHRDELMWKSMLQPLEASLGPPMVAPAGGHSTKEQDSVELFQLYGPSQKDIHRRPIIVVSSRYLGTANTLSLGGVSSPRVQALRAFERLRIHLASTMEVLRSNNSNEIEALQCVLIIDLAGARVSSTSWDMIQWLRRDAIDLFPGLCSAVFVVNYSREFGAIWIACKQILPASAKSRILFPTKEELLHLFGSDQLPTSLGGTCTTPLLFTSHKATASLLTAATETTSAVRDEDEPTTRTEASRPRRWSTQKVIRPLETFQEAEA